MPAQHDPICSAAPRAGSPLPIVQEPMNKQAQSRLLYKTCKKYSHFNKWASSRVSSNGSVLQLLLDILSQASCLASCQRLQVWCSTQKWSDADLIVCILKVQPSGRSFRQGPTDCDLRLQVVNFQKLINHLCCSGYREAQLRASDPSCLSTLSVILSKKKKKKSSNEACLAGLN